MRRPPPSHLPCRPRTPQDRLQRPRRPGRAGRLPPAAAWLTLSLVAGRLPSTAASASPPPERAVVLDPALYWHSYRWPGDDWTQAATFDDFEGVARFTVVEPEARHVWRYRLALPVQVDRYPLLALTCRTSPGLPAADEFLLWLDDGRGPAYSDWFPLRADALVSDGQVHTLRADLRSSGPGRTVYALAVAVHSGERVPGRLEVLDLRFEAAKADEPPPPAAPVTVRVEDDGGQPLDGVTVTLDAERTNWARSQITDQNGIVVVTPLATESGEHMLRLRRSGWVEVEVAGLGAHASPRRVHLERGTMYGGLVVDAAGAPLPGVVVEVHVRRPAGSGDKGLQPTPRPLPVLFTDAHGRWRTPVLPAAGIGFDLRLSHPESGAARVESDVPARVLRDGTSRIVLTGTEITVHRAAQRGLTDWLETALQQDASLVDQREDQRTPLHTAARYDRVAVIRLLLDHGADIDDAGPGKTPLHEAVEFGSVETARALLDRGADPDARAVSDSTPLHHAIWARTDNRCTTGELRRSIELLAEHGADLNAVHRTVGTPLEYALQVAPGEIVELLRGLGATTRTSRGD